MDIKSKIETYKNELIVVGIVLVTIIAIKIIFGLNTGWIKQLVEQGNLLNDKKQLVKNWEVTKGEYNKLKDKFLKNDEDFLKKIVEEEAKKIGVNIIYLNPKTIKKDKYIISEINLKIEAPYNKIVTFVQFLEENNIFVKKFYIQKANNINREAELYLRGFILWEKK